jgi:hypothetical protein
VRGEQGVWMKIIIRLCFFVVFLSLTGCISSDNETIDGTGTPDINGSTPRTTIVIDEETGEEKVVCSPIPGILDGSDYVPRSNAFLGDDGRKHPDIFYLGWSRLDDRTDLRFPTKGYDNKGFEDILLVSRRQSGGDYKTWQIWPPLDNDCLDTEKIRIHSFDVAPDGKSLFVSMSREEEDNPNRKLGIYRLNIAEQTIEKISKDNTVDFINPTYVGNDPAYGEGSEPDHEVLLVAKTVKASEIPINYDDPDKPFFDGSIENDELKDEYDRAGTPLIHRMDAVTGDTVRIGFNNSHQTEPFVTTDITDPDNPIKIVAFTQWEHQASDNRFSLWKTQIDGSDNFTFYGEESATDDADPNIFQGREIKSGPYKNYIIMTQGARKNARFAAEGHIIMTKRKDLDLRSPRVFLQTLKNNGVDEGISYTPEYYNDDSFVYAYRATSDNSHSLFVKDFPESTDTDDDGELDPDTDIENVDRDPGKEILADVDLHLVMPRSFYLPDSELIAPVSTDIRRSRSSFTNTNLDDNAGFLVQNLGESDNGVQHQLDGIDPDDLSLQFYVPSHHFQHSQAISTANNPELSIPVGGFMKPYADGSLGAILKEGLYVWKVHKQFDYTDDQGTTSDLWLPIRAERQEISFVKNRVNACNQCHQERDQANLDLYANYNSVAADVMKGDLSTIKGTHYDVSDADAYENIPDYHAKIAPLFTEKTNKDGQTCADCHNQNDKLNLSNKTGVSKVNAMYRTLVQGAHKLEDSETTIPYLSQSINPLGMNNSIHPAPFLWSLLLDNDLTEPEDGTHSNTSNRDLDREGDYGARFDQAVADEIEDINTNRHDHLGHWSIDDMQDFITYSTTQSAVGLSNHIEFTKNSIARGDAIAQKAYQALRRNCFNCHNNHPNEGIDAEGFGKPKEKRFTSSTLLKDSQVRFVIKSHVSEKEDTEFSSLLWESNITNSMSYTLLSASYRIDFDNLDNSELLVYARNDDDLNDTVDHTGSGAHTFAGLAEDSDDYIAIRNWVHQTAGVVNNPPTIDSDVQNTITIKEYDEPAFQGQPITWSDPDNTSPPNHELSQLFLASSGTSEHSINDTMLALQYDSFSSAKIKTYAILGDRGEQDLEFVISDGMRVNTNEKLKVTITSDYDVPAPSSALPDAYAFYTKRATSELRKLDTNGEDISIGTIRDTSDVTLDITDWTTVYRRAEKGWLYFLNQNEQKVYVVDETTAVLQSVITLDHSDEKETDSHKQTVYLIWWREPEGVEGEANYTPGGLEGLLESKLSKTKDGDFHVDLGTPAEVDAGADVTVNTDYKTKLKEGDIISAYIWRRATFMSKWTLNEVDSLHVLNLVTGKPKELTDFTFEAKTIGTETYDAAEYSNVRAVVVAKDGAFYGFNKDINDEVVVFNFDPIEKVQKVVDTVPDWIEDYLNNQLEYGTPFLVINERS